MQKPPLEIDGAKVLYHFIIKPTQRPTGEVQHWVNGESMPAASALAIVQYPADTAVYLLHCDANWNALNDDYLESIEDAITEIKRQYQDIRDEDLTAI